jgi:NADH pyrophosphatase NudC (nudix superfamily)
MISIFRGDPHHPYHLSIGVVLLKDHQTVYTHRYTSLQKEGEKRVLHNIYTLIRETLEPGESLEEAIARGIQEEMGAVGEILTYI